jgi:hypothetical protein
VRDLLGWFVVKAQATTIFSVELTEYGWSVRDGATRLGLFVSQRQALDDVRKRRAALKTEGRASAVEVIGEEAEGTRGGSRRPFSHHR